MSPDVAFLFGPEGLAFGAAMAGGASLNQVLAGDFSGCEKICGIRLPKWKRMRNIRVLAGGDANENKVAE